LTFRPPFCEAWRLMEVWRLLAPYLVTGLLLTFFGWVAVRSIRASPPLGHPVVAHLTIAFGMAFVLVLVLVDTGRINDIAALRWQGKLIALEHRLDTVERALFEGYKTEEFLIKDVKDGGATPPNVEIEETRHDSSYPWRLNLTLKEEAVPNSVQSWENGMSTQPERISVQGKTLTLKMYYDPRPGTDVVIRYYQRGP